MSYKASRRDFLKLSAVAGYGAAAAQVLKPTSARAQGSAGTTVMGLRTPKMERVRVGFIGLGRGSGHLGDMLKIEGAEVTALCDIHQPTLDRALKRVADAGKPKPATFSDGPEAYKKMLERDDVDIVYIATPWELHIRHRRLIRCGLESTLSLGVPAAITTEECWRWLIRRRRRGVTA